MMSGSVWEVRVELATSTGLSTDMAAQTTAALTQALHSIPGIDQAWASLTYHQSSVTLGATVVLEGTSAGEAVDAAARASVAIGVAADSITEAEVRSAEIDPRD